MSMKKDVSNSSPFVFPDSAVLTQYVSQKSTAQIEADMDKAQDLFYEACDAASRKRRIDLAHQAIMASPLCADAYVLLLIESNLTDNASCEHLSVAVEAGRLALGDAFDDYVGEFWGFLETRPYMRARHSLAMTLWRLGRQEEAMAHYREMLRLNPNDNQGIRYLMAACYLELEQYDLLKRLLKEYVEDASAFWLYTRALLHFSASGPEGKSANKILQEANEANEHIPAFLLGASPLPDTEPDYMTVGGEDEAADYVHACGAGWRKTPGALDWLDDRLVSK